MREMNEFLDRRVPGAALLETLLTRLFGIVFWALGVPERRPDPQDATRYEPGSPPHAGGMSFTIITAGGPERVRAVRAGDLTDGFSHEDGLD
jgi:hypothetical protein